MTGLLAKDLRLSLDTLRPWALTVVGVIVAAFLLRLFPESMLPAFVAQLAPADLLSVFAVAIGGSAVVVSAWSTATIVQGDRMHGGELLAASLPVAPRERAASKLLVMAIAVLVPAVAATVAFALARAARPGAEDGWPLSIAVWGLGISAAGAGLAMPWALLARGPSKIVFLALLAGTTYGVAGALGAWFVHRRFVANAAAAFAEPERNFMHLTDLVLAGERARLVAVAAAIGVAALIGLLIGVAAIGRCSARRWIPWALGGALVAAFAAGLVAARSANERDEAFWHSPTGAVMRAAHLDDVALAREIGRWDDARRRNIWTVPTDLETFAEEGGRRMAAATPSLRAGNPILKALEAAQDGASRDLAEPGILLLPAGDESRRAAALDGVVRFPESTWMRWILSRELARLPGAPPSDPELDNSIPRLYLGPSPSKAVWNEFFTARRRRAITAALLAQLEWARGRDDLDSAKVGLAIDLLRSEPEPDAADRDAGPGPVAPRSVGVHGRGGPE